MASKQLFLDSFLKRKTTRKDDEENLIERGKKVKEEIIAKENDKELSEEKSITLLENTNLKIYSWNVNGFRALMNKKAIESFIDKENPDIICFNEVKLDEKILKKENYENLFKEKDYYQTYWNLCQSNFSFGYSGVAVFTKSPPMNVKKGINNPEHDKEGRVLTLEFENFFLVSVYVPNSGRELKRLDYRVKKWDLAFKNYLDELKNNNVGKDLVICGDLNVAHKEIDIFNAKGHLKYAGFTLEERKNFTSFLESGYLDSFRHLYPRTIKFSYFFSAYGKKNIKENKGWRLDYFIINSESIQRLVDSEILTEYDESDHSPIKLTWKV